LAEELLETTTLPVEQIAGQVGFRSAAVFREQFAARRGVAPRDYRRTFGPPPS
jgi:transcriptional regulator GlxA family with amidase domain